MNCDDALAQPRPLVPENLKIVMVAAAALVDRDDRVLIAQRPEGKAMAGLWEFPGGKMKAGETPEFALMRELEEELGIETRPTCFTPIAFASHAYDDFHLLMPLFGIRAWRGVPQPREHATLKWVSANDLYDYPMPAADIPLIGPLRDWV